MNPEQKFTLVEIAKYVEYHVNLVKITEYKNDLYENVCVLFLYHKVDMRTETIFSDVSFETKTV